MSADGRWFEPLAEHMGAAYLRYSFTKGTTQEIDFLVEVLDLEPGHTVLDVGCGPGRHTHELARRGIDAVGVDLSAPFCALVRDGGSPVVRADVAALPAAARADAVLCLCQGGFGLLGGPGAPVDADVAAFGQIARTLRPGGRLALSAFSSYFQVRYAEAGDTFDADAGVNHERTEVRDASGRTLDADLWTTGFTPRELRLLAAGAGLEVDAVWSVSPGAYARTAPTVDSPELLLLAHRPR